MYHLIIFFLVLVGIILLLLFKEKIETIESLETPLVLITQWHLPENSTHWKEPLLALCLNLVNKQIDHVVLLQGDSFSEKDEKRLFKFIGHCSSLFKMYLQDQEKEVSREGYQALVDVLKENCQIGKDGFVYKTKTPIVVRTSEENGEALYIPYALKYANLNWPNTKVAISNGDIFLDNSFQNLRTDKRHTPRTVYFLSRHEFLLPQQTLTELQSICPRATNLCQCGLLFQQSHDVFLFHTPIPKNVVGKAKVSLGTFGVENILAETLIEEGLVLTNPCKKNKIWHVHGKRTKKVGRFGTIVDVPLPFPEL